MPAGVSVVLPCLNEGARIAATLSTLSSWFTPPPEIVVVDDGSTDDTVAQARRYAREHPHVRVHPLTHRGKGAAIRTAIPLVTRDRVVLLDADLPFDRESVTAVIEALAGADMALGNRRHHGSRYTVPVRLFGFLYRRHLVGLTFNIVARVLLQLRHRDTQCGLKGFRREVLQQMAPSLTIDGFALDVEMLLAARALDLRTIEVPVQVRYESAASTVHILRGAAAVSGELARLWLRKLAGRYSAARIRSAGSGGRTRAAGQPSTGQTPRTDPEE